jgi:hypothetical protein
VPLGCNLRANKIIGLSIFDKHFPFGNTSISEQASDRIVIPAGDNSLAFGIDNFSTGKNQDSDGGEST